MKNEVLIQVLISTGNLTSSQIVGAIFIQDSIPFTQLESILAQEFDSKISYTQIYRHSLHGWIRVHSKQAYQPISRHCENPAHLLLVA